MTTAATGVTTTAATGMSSAGGRRGWRIVNTGLVYEMGISILYVYIGIGSRQYLIHIRLPGTGAEHDEEKVNESCQDNSKQCAAKVSHGFCDSFPLQECKNLLKGFVCTGVIIVVMVTGCVNISIIRDGIGSGVGDAFMGISITVKINLV